MSHNRSHLDKTPEEVIVPHHPYKPDAGIVGNVVAKRKPRFEPDFHKAFDGKDDENFIARTLKITQYTAAAWLVCTGADVILWDRQGVLNTLRRGIFWGIPLIGGGLAYTATVCAVASFRKKDGKMNHFYGGLAAGSVLGTARSNFPMGLVTGLGLGLIGATYKSSKMEGYELFPKMPNIERTYAFGHKMDYTTWPEMPANWVRELPKEE